MLSYAPHRAPAHVRDLEALAVRAAHCSIAKADDVACEHAQAGSGPFLAVLEEHLQAEADAQEGPVARRGEHDLAQTAVVHAADAIGHGALTRQHDALRIA